MTSGQDIPMLTGQEEYEMTGENGQASVAAGGYGILTIALIAACIIGGAGGIFYALTQPGAMLYGLESQLNAVLSAVRAGAGIPSSIVLVVANHFKYLLLVAVGGLCAIGGLLTPLAFVLKSFALSYTVTAMVRLFGLDGLYLALALTAPANILLLPCMFYLGNEALVRSLDLAGLYTGRQPVLPKKLFVRRIASVFTVAALIIPAQIYLTPLILKQLAAVLQ